MASNINSAPNVMDHMSTMLARNWGWVALRGVLALVVGAIALAIPLAALGGLVLVFGVYSIIDGGAAIASAIRAARADERWGWLLVEGVIDFGAAAVALFLPGIAIAWFVIIIGIWAIFSGGAMVIVAFRLHTDHGRIWLGLGGALSVIWGVLLLLQPGIGALVMTMWFGAYALVFGVILVILAFRLRSVANRLMAG
jgi:uncharacterized membrane protein HdeD (DUF308 family)